MAEAFGGRRLQRSALDRSHVPSLAASATHAHRLGRSARGREPMTPSPPSPVAARPEPRPRVLQRLGWRGRDRSINQKIFWAAAITASLSICTKLFAIGRESLVARQFGRSDALDAFLIALMLPEFLASLIAGSFGSAFIPSFIAARNDQPRQARTQLLSSVVTASLLLLLVCSLLVCAAASYYLPWLASGFSAAKLVVTRHLLYSLAPYLIFGGLAVIYIAILNSEESFALPAASAILPPLLAILLLLTCARPLGIYVLSIGFAGGSLLQCLILGPAVRRRYPGFRFGWHGADRYLRQIGSQYTPMLAGAFLMGCTTLVDQVLAATLPAGSVAALAYANRIILAVLALGSVSISSAMLPYFSQQIASCDWKGCRHTLYTYAKWTMAASLLLTAALIIFSEPLVRLLYQRGAFKPADAVLVSHLFIALALQIPFYVVGILFVRLLSALQGNGFLLWGAVIALPVDVALDLFFMHFWGIVGIALATSCMYLATTAAAALFTPILFRRRMREVRR
ncbi:MAG: virulence factor MviN [Acidobacteria bacterium]|nr:MAG: virulence factor MviN [Acidobacteriota bacterium]